MATARRRYASVSTADRTGKRCVAPAGACRARGRAQWWQSFGARGEARISDERLRAELGAAVRGAESAQLAADRPCEACVGLLDVDGASISLVLDGTSRGTLGASGALSRQLDELQFTFGQGPCLDAVHGGVPVLVADLDDPAETRWPAFTEAVLLAGVSAVFALPVSLAASRVGALDLFRHQRGRLNDRALAGGLLAAELARLPLLDLLAGQAGTAAGGQPAGRHGSDGPDSADGVDEDGWTQLASLDRVEVYQATGMLMGALDVDQTEALVRLRAHAYAHGTTAAQIAATIVERRIALTTPDWQDPPPLPGSGR